MKQLDVQKSVSVVLEDSLNGIWSGKLVGCYVIAVPTKHAAGLDYSEADIIIHSLEQAVDNVRI